jgi:hypothetical protein
MHDRDTMNTLRKRGHERFVFCRFCASAGLAIVEGSLESGEDPPDLRADLKDFGRTAFELVRLNDPDDLKAKNRVGLGDRLLNESFAGLDDSRRAALTTKFVDCGINICFSGTESDAARKQALGFLWKVLEDLPAEHNGQVHLPRPSSPSALSLVYVTHAHCDDGPHLRAFGSGGEYPLDLEQLRKKLTTPYDGSERLELLAYVERGEIAHLGATEQVGELVTELLLQSSFHTVWVYEGLLDRVAFAVCRTSPLGGARK